MPKRAEMPFHDKFMMQYKFAFWEFIQHDLNILFAIKTYFVLGLNTWCKKTKIFYSKWVIHTFSVKGSMNAFRLQMSSFSPPPPLLQMRKIIKLLPAGSFFQESTCFTYIFYLLDFKDKWLCQKATLGLFFTKQMARGTFAFLCLKNVSVKATHYIKDCGNYQPLLHILQQFSLMGHGKPEKLVAF